MQAVTRDYVSRIMIRRVKWFVYYVGFPILKNPGECRNELLSGNFLDGALHAPTSSLWHREITQRKAAGVDDSKQLTLEKRYTRSVRIDIFKTSCTKNPSMFPRFTQVPKMYL
jgi:hypothetical protein